MDNLKIDIISDFYMNDDTYDIDQVIQKEDYQSTINFDFQNIPQIVLNIIVNNKLKKNISSDDLKLIRLFYSTNISDINILSERFADYISKLNVKEDKELVLYKYLEEIINIFYELNVIDDRVKVKCKEK